MAAWSATSRRSGGPGLEEILMERRYRQRGRGRLTFHALKSAMQVVLPIAAI